MCKSVSPAPPRLTVSCSTERAWGSGDSYSPSPSNRHTCFNHSLTFSMADVRAHGRAHSDDPWVVIDKGVYAVGAFLETHPGGGDALRRAAGTDATATFLAHNHSPAAVAALDAHFLGTLEDDDDSTVAALLDKAAACTAIKPGTQSLCAFMAVLGMVTSYVYLV